MTTELVIHPSITDLLKLGRSRGWLSVDELNATLPDEYVDTGPIEEILFLTQAAGITLVDEPSARARRYRLSKANGSTDSNGQTSTSNGGATTHATMRANTEAGCRIKRRMPQRTVPRRSRAKSTRSRAPACDDALPSPGPR